MRPIPLSLKVRSVGLVLVGVAVLVLKPHYRGPLGEWVQSYLGNVSVSFAVYFLATLSAYHFPRPRLVAAVAALAAVESFELLDGFGVMSNTYDPWDLLANALGVALAWAVDATVERYLTAKRAKVAKGD